MTNLFQARDAVLSIVAAGWSASGITTAMPLFFDDTSEDKPGEEGSTTKPESFGRAKVSIAASSQTTQGNRRWVTVGTLSVQTFTPRGDGHSLGDVVAQVVIDALRAHTGSTDGVWFADIQPEEIGDDGPHFQINVNATLRYQETL